MSISVTKENYGPSLPSLALDSEIIRATTAETTLAVDIDTVSNAIPTAVSQLTNNSGYQTATDVSAAIQTVVGAAPAALNTLVEIAAQLSADETITAAILSTVNGKANTSALLAKADLTANTFTGQQSITEVNKGTIASGSVSFAVSGGNVQKLTVGGGLSIALTGWPIAGVFGELLIELVNGGSAALTLPNIKGILPDTGAPAASFSAYLTAIGRTGLQAAGTDFFYLWSTDGGVTVYGKVM